MLTADKGGGGEARDTYRNSLYVLLWGSEANEKMNRAPQHAFDLGANKSSPVAMARNSKLGQRSDEKHLNMRREGIL